MKLASYRVRGETTFGLYTDEGMIDLRARLDLRYPTLADFIAHGRLGEAEDVAHEAPDHGHAEATLLKPLDRWGKCFCVGVNYPERNAEYKDGAPPPSYPSLFVRFPETFVGPGEPLIRPPESPQLDYEGEVVLVIGAPGRRIAEDAWRDHVWGYTIANEGTIRDWVRHGKFNVTPGKNWASSGAIGPWIVPRSDAGGDEFAVTTRVNGEVRQQDSTARLVFPFGRIIAYISTFCPLAPGDIILTGTPAGAGARLDPPRYLTPGDVVEVEVSGLGLLRNTVADEIPHIA